MNPPNQLTPALAPTPRTDAAYFENGATMYSLAGEMKLLERELAAAQAELVDQTSRFRDEIVHRQETVRCNKELDLKELTRLRAEVERFTGHGLLDCHAICDQRDAAVAERDHLRAEVERLKEQLRIESAASAHALHWAEKAEAELHALRLVCGTSDADKFTTWLNVAIARAEKAEAECLEQARLLGMSGEREADLLGKLGRLERELAAMKGTP